MDVTDDPAGASSVSQLRCRRTADTSGIPRKESTTRPPAPLVLRLPRQRRNFISLAIAALLHLVLVLLLVGLVGEELVQVHTPGDSTAARGGGGGGGGGGRREQYISLPAIRPPATAPTPEIRKPVVPQIIVRTPVKAPVTPPVTPPPVDSVRTAAPTAAPPSQVAAAGTTRDTVAGNGAGQGGGAGGGTGGGQGPGNGPGTGPGNGTGGQGGRGVRPQMRQFLLTPENPPKDLRGKEVKVTFWIGADGRVQHLVVNPEIKDRGYAKDLVERMEKYLFTPARSPAGVPIADTTTFTFTLGQK
ncbi:MAG: hypothetical protein ABJD11_16140 [Gemmatimonadota bacterium]